MGVGGTDRTGPCSLLLSMSDSVHVQAWNLRISCKDSATYLYTTYIFIATFKTLSRMPSSYVGVRDVRNPPIFVADM